MISASQLTHFLNDKAAQYEKPNFIDSDPIGIPKRFTKKEDIEIAAFFSATIAWGQRVTIINNANKLMALMDEEPHNFITQHSEKECKVFEKFVHRTFNGIDCIYFMHALKHIYLNKGGLEKCFTPTELHPDIAAKSAIEHFRSVFFELEHLPRTQKHVSSPAKNSSAKRLNMFLRWMVRSSNLGVDFGMWKVLKSEQLIMPLDVHTGNVGRKLKLLSRKQNDFKAALELTQNLRKFDAHDPVKYDFALFGLGVFEKF